jgi:hypothetical protein
MAQETTLTESAVRIARAIHAFAARKGWNPEDYRIFMTANGDLLTLRITIAAKAYEGRTEEKEFEDYDELRDYLDSQVKADVRRFNYYSLVLTGRNGYAFYAVPRLGPSEIEIDDALINNGVSWREPFQPAGVVKRAK